MISLEIPGNPLRAKVVGPPQVKDLLDILGRYLSGMAPGNGAFPDQTFNAVFLIAVLPAVERRSGDLKCQTCLTDISDPQSVIENRPLAPDRECLSQLYPHG